MIGYILSGVTIVLLIITIVILLTKLKKEDDPQKFQDILNQIQEAIREENRFIDDKVTIVNENIRSKFDSTNRMIDSKFDSVKDAVNESNKNTLIALADNNTKIMELLVNNAKDSQKESGILSDRIILQTNEISKQNSENLKSVNETLSREIASIRNDMTKNMKEIRDDVNSNLEKIKNSVDEQLQTNLEKKLQESFRTVSAQLRAVETGIGEMRSLAANVGDLKKTLSNVKNRGILGEIQLGNILSDILSPSQYDTNVITVPGSTCRVEFAVKLPGTGDNHVYLPIDSKFPADTYHKLLDAYDLADSSLVEFAWKELEKVLTSEAKDIHEKYIHVPDTTEFGIMFLPTEGLYAEAVRHGMVEKLQNQYKINIAGPTTLAALLNSLQMGFKTLQIQKQSGDVWKILQNTKTEFEKYAECLEKVQNSLKKTQDELDNLVGVRTRKMALRLSDVEKYEQSSLSE